MSVLDLILIYHVCFCSPYTKGVVMGGLHSPLYVLFYIFALIFLYYYTIIYVDVMSFCIWNRIISAKSIMIILIIFFLFYGSFNMVWDFTLTVLVCYEVFLIIEWA